MGLLRNEKGIIKTVLSLLNCSLALYTVTQSIPLSGTPEVTLLLASNLPPNNYERNAFRNSVFYEYAKNILFVRKERMDSIGEFVVLILHSMAHIHVGEMTDDGNAHFLRLFYKVCSLLSLYAGIQNDFLQGTR